MPALLLLAACGAHAPPTHTAIDASAHPAVSQLATIELAPIDVTLPIGPSGLTEAPELRSMTKDALQAAAAKELSRRAFVVATRHGTAPSTADATLFIRSGAYVPKPTLADETFGTERLSEREQPYVGPITAAIYSDLVCGDSVYCATSVALSQHVRPSEDVDTLEVMRNTDTIVMPEGDPAFYVGMTLVDNRTGEILWRAHGRSTANATKDREVASTVKHVLASLPSTRAAR